MRDEGRPLGIGLQEQVPNHPKLLWSRAMVVSIEEKLLHDGSRCDSGRRTKVNHSMKCRKAKDDVKTGGWQLLRDKRRSDLLTGCAASGI